VYGYILKQNQSSNASNAVINKEVEIERKDHWVNKIWKREDISTQNWRINSVSFVRMEECYRL
jgi:hypothetical protein